MQYGSSLSQLQSSIDEVVSLHASLLNATDAPVVLAEVVRAKNRLAAFEAAVSARCVETGIAAMSGARDGASWIANATGSTVGAARETLQTAAVLSTQPDVALAFAAGELSSTQASLISSAVVSSPSSAPGLLASVRSGSSLVELKRSCRTAIDDANSRDHEVNEWECKRRSRYFRSRVASDGMVTGEFRLMPDDGAVLLARLRPFIEQAYSDARARKGVIVQEHLAADGFVGLVESAGVERKTRRVDIIVSVDADSLARGYATNGEVCEISGLGSVPVALVESLRNDAHLSVIVRKELKPLFVVSETREITSAQRNAVLHRDRCCRVPGCGSTYQLEIDHIRERRHGGRHQIDNLMTLCAFHHRQKTFYGYRMVGGGDARIWCRPDELSRRP